MKYEFEVKDKALKTILSVFDKRRIQEEIFGQINNGLDYIELGYKSSFNMNLKFAKSIVKKVYSYDPDDWNLFPRVTPIKNENYLVQRKSRINGDLFCDVLYWSGGDGSNDSRWEDLNVVAFHKLPQPFDPNELKDG